MSTTPPQPPRRRRIAGEAKPAVPPAAPAARRTVKKPLARPGRATPAPAPAAPKAPTVRTPTTRGRGATGGDSATAPATSPAAATSTTAPADPAPPSRRPRVPAAWRSRAPWILLAVLALVVGAILGARGVAQLNETRGLAGAHDDAADAAATAAETIFSYRYDRLDAYLEDAQALMTPSFAEEFETISPALTDLAPQRQIQVEATTRGAAPTPCGNSCSRTSTSVLVFVDQARLADGEEVPTVFGNRITLTMVERDGRWLVDDVVAL